MSKLTIHQNDFHFEDKPLTIISGAIHYFRVVPEYWEDRLLKLKAGGFNTVETYVPWNLHEPQKGVFHFEGLANITAFIRLAGDLGLHVIVRPSPYICAEWEFGGLPAWLLAEPDMQLRCMHPSFIAHLDSYYDTLLPLLRPLLSTNGGPIIAMQIENEYGSFGNDKAYLKHLQEGMIARGIDVLLFTSDGPEDFMLQGGMLDGVLETVNFGSRAEEAFAKLREYQPEGPLMCMEYWNGWFDHWHGIHNVREADSVAEVLDDMLRVGASVNFYMFHGGTNFGYTSGANSVTPSAMEPTITSYDYDSPLSESGDPTAKFYAVREVISKYVELPPLELPAPIPKADYGAISLDGSAILLDQLTALASPVSSVVPQPMEAYGQNDGFILYETHISGPRPEKELHLQDCHDRALVFIDGQYLGTVERWNPDQKLSFSIPKEGIKLQVLVENMGRINYGAHMLDRKGVTVGIRHGLQFLYHWQVYNLPLNDLSKLQYAPVQAHKEAGAAEQKGDQQPSFYRATFTIDEAPADTFLHTKGWSKGLAFINGFNLGRYWHVGPQESLYIPAPLLKQGVNELVLFDIHGNPHAQASISLKDTPALGPTS